MQHSRLPCPSLSPRVCSNSRPLSQWCYLTILCCPLLLLPSVFSSIRVFSSELALRIRWPKYWNFSISPSNNYSRLISFRIDWFEGPLWVCLKSMMYCNFRIQSFKVDHSVHFWGLNWGSNMKSFMYVMVYSMNENPSLWERGINPSIVRKEKYGQGDICRLRIL